MNGEANEGSICDRCGEEFSGDEAQTCDGCGGTFCERHIGALDHECQEQ